MIKIFTKASVAIIITLIFMTAQANKINDDYALIYLIDSDCTSCEKFNAVVDKLKRKYNFTVYPFSPDGKGLYDNHNIGYLSKTMLKYFDINDLYFPTLMLYDKNSVNSLFSLISQGDKDYNTVESGLNNILEYLEHKKMIEGQSNKRKSISLSSVQVRIFEDLVSLNTALNTNATRN
ncbi:conjugal transfer protein TraF [Francisellaceae bacterium CB300]